MIVISIYKAFVKFYIYYIIIIIYLLTINSKFLNAERLHVITYRVGNKLKK